MEIILEIVILIFMGKIAMRIIGHLLMEGDKLLDRLFDKKGGDGEGS